MAVNKSECGNFVTRMAHLAMAATIATGLVGLSAVTPGEMITTQARAQGPESVADLAEGLLGAVVNISTSQKIKQNNSNRPKIPNLPEGSPFQDFFDDLFPNQPGGEDNGPRTAQSLGSGFVLNPEGIIITNNHVIAEADEITVNFSDGSKLTAELIGTDPKTDIAVLRVKPEKPLTAVSLGDSEKARIGDWVMAIGNPFGLGGTVTLGIVSAIGRDINSGPYDNFIQTDASINRGNSGGPLFNMDGEVIGINTAIISPSGGSIGIGFSIPSSLARQVIDQLVEFGETRRGWLGVQIQSVSDEIAESLGLEEAAGALVGDVVKDGPAEAGGVLPGDVILSFDGHEVKEMRDLPRIVADTPVDKKVDVEVLRKGKKETVKVTVGRLEDGEKKMAENGDKKGEKKGNVDTATALGLTVRAITGEDRETDKISEDIKGVLITEVEKGSHAEEKGIKPNEIIVQVGQEPVSDPDEFEKLVKGLNDEGRKNALLMVSSPMGDVRFVVVRMK